MEFLECLNFLKAKLSPSSVSWINFLDKHTEIFLLCRFSFWTNILGWGKTLQVIKNLGQWFLARMFTWNWSSCFWIVRLLVMIIVMEGGSFSFASAVVLVGWPFLCKMQTRNLPKISLTLVSAHKSILVLEYPCLPCPVRIRWSVLTCNSSIPWCSAKLWIQNLYWKSQILRGT